MNRKRREDETYEDYKKNLKLAEFTIKWYLKGKPYIAKGEK